jgi:TonB family protein
MIRVEAGLSGRPRSLAMLGMTMFLACVHTVTTYYLPDAHNPRFDADGATQVLNQYLRVQCPERLAAKKTERGNASLTITIDTSGSVTRAELVSSSGDEMLDGLFGAVTAQLKVDSLRATKQPLTTRPIRVDYDCAQNGAGATLEVLRS